jgi:hypothetical protein
LKAVCHPSAAATVRARLEATAGVEAVMVTGLGEGARLLTDG